MSLLDTTIFSPAWWLSSAIGVLVLGMIGMYLKDVLDKVARSLWGKWRNRSDKVREAFAADVAALRASSDLRQAYFQNEMRYRHRATMSMVQVTASLLIMIACFAVTTLAKHGVLPLSSTGLIVTRVFGAITGLMGLVASMSATFENFRFASLNARLDAAQEFEQKVD
ncbi:hypothetical protein [Burkholderia anthina]|uniref:hypothetical protein n=1 Tax=Burkholderia anthina TaxID=179879 RepID=UPI0012D8868E|nr:hypothetical protein [Burkholderia anthina]